MAAAADFDAILQTAADSPAVAALVASAGVFSQARRIASVETMRSKLPEVGKHHLLAHREIVQALRTRDPDLVEQAVRAQLRAAYDLLLSDLDAPSASRR